ncbi:MAG: hypothetical protein WCW02_04440 [Candidatus Buchananbacteria bacterium]
MNELFKKIKLEFFYLRKAFFEYHQGWAYLYYRYVVAKRIIRVSRVLEKPINRQDFSIHVLTCHRDFVMTIWSLASFYQTAKVVGELYLHNDGSLNERELTILKKLFPSAKAVNTKTFLIDWKSALVPYPTLKEYREKYINFFSFKKIIDPYFVSNKNNHLIFDSDVLWLGNPAELMAEIEGGPKRSLVQKNNTAVCPPFKNGFELSEKLTWVNAGIVLYNIENFDLAKLSELFKNLDEKCERSLHFADQTGYAYCLKNLELLSAEKYVIRAQVTPAVIAKHYTSPRRPLFYLEGIKVWANKIL